MLREVRTENGWVRGIPAADPRITAFKGIPFAAPPVGVLRWRAPQPAADWDGVLDCCRFGPIAMQWTPGADPSDFYAKEWHVDPEIPMGEDCLQLNVWTPAKNADEKLPVMVWIYGGGLNCGYPAEMEFDGERLARRGVILVSVNYRVNVFGFLAHPELTAEDPEHPTNFGHLDQQFGIQWVKRNIAAFGGDPENITVFGQSAGAGSTFIQAASPMNRGLFQKAVLQSGGGLLAPSLGSPDLPDAERTGEEFFRDLGVTTLEEARALDARTVFEKAVEGGKYTWGTVIGDPFMPEHPTEIFRKNMQNDVLIMTGNTEDEFPAVSRAKSMEEFEAYAEALFAERKDEYLALCGVTRDAKAGAAEAREAGASGVESDEAESSEAGSGGSVLEKLAELKEAGRFNRFEIGNMMLVDLLVSQGRRPYFYTFDPEIPGDCAGSFHSSDLWFVFETLAKCWRPFTGKHYDLARQMCNYWTNFAKSGDPNGLDADGTPMPEWRPATASDPAPMWFGDAAHMDDRGRTQLESFLVDYYEEKKDDRKISSPFIKPRKADGTLL